MAEKGKISLYNLSLEKTILDFYNYFERNEGGIIKKDRYSLFYPMIGKEFYQQKQLMVYSQYAQDWQPTFKLTKDKSIIEEIVRKSYLYSTPNKKCALDWVNKRWVKDGLFRSFLWNITYKLAVDVYARTEDNWNEIVAWSNLLKITPFDSNKDPLDVFSAQLVNSAHLFKEELSLLQPRNVILITNLDKWAGPLLKTAGIKYKEHQDKYIEATAAYRGSQIIITQKPFAGNHTHFIKEIKKYLV